MTSTNVGGRGAKGVGVSMGVATLDSCVLVGVFSDWKKLSIAGTEQAMEAVIIEMTATQIPLRIRMDPPKLIRYQVIFA
jgi:hypothetical protein